MRNRLKDTLRIAVIAAVLIGLAALPAAAAEKLKIGCLESPEGPNTLGWKTFEQYVESNAGGFFDIDIYPSSQLGDSEKLLEGLKLGIHKMAQGDESITGAYDPMKIWFVPYLFSDEQVMKKFFESATFKTLNDMVAEDLGVRVLAAAPYGFYNFINKRRPVKTLEDMKGLKLRTLPSSQLTIKSWSALGASATPVAWADIYTAIKTGIIDGLGHTLTMMVDQKFDEVAKYVTLDMSMGCANLYLVNEKWYRGLPVEMQGILKKGAELGASAEFGIASYRNRVRSIDLLKEHNVEIYSLSPEEKARFKKAAHDVVMPWVRKKSGDEIVDAVLAEIEKIEESLSGIQ